MWLYAALRDSLCTYVYVRVRTWHCVCVRGVMLYTERGYITWYYMYMYGLQGLHTHVPSDGLNATCRWASLSSSLFLGPELRVLTHGLRDTHSARIWSEGCESSTVRSASYCNRVQCSAMQCNPQVPMVTYEMHICTFKPGSRESTWIIHESTSESTIHKMIQNDYFIIFHQIFLFFHVRICSPLSGVAWSMSLLESMEAAASVLWFFAKGCHCGNRRSCGIGSVFC